MGKYITRRFFEMIITLFLIGTATFFLLGAIPGTAIDKKIQKLPEATKQVVIEKYAKGTFAEISGNDRQGARSNGGTRIRSNIPYRHRCSAEQWGAARRSCPRLRRLDYRKFRRLPRTEWRLDSLGPYS